MPRAIILILILMFCSGCAKIFHLRQLLTLKAYSDNKDLQLQCVLENRENLKKLLEAVRTGEIVQFKTSEDFLKTFGEPVVLRTVPREGKPVQEWLYRELVAGVRDVEKVYVYFDLEGNLLDWHYYEGKSSQG